MCDAVIPPAQINILYDIDRIFRPHDRADNFVNGFLPVLADEIEKIRFFNASGKKKIKVARKSGFPVIRTRQIYIVHPQIHV